MVYLQNNSNLGNQTHVDLMVMLYLNNYYQYINKYHCLQHKIGSELCHETQLHLCIRHTYDFWEN